MFCHYSLELFADTTLKQNLVDIIFGLDSVDEYSCGRARRYGGSGLADADAAFRTIIGRFADRRGVSTAQYQ